MDSLIINVDSRDRDKSKYPNESNFVFELNDTIKNIVSLSLSSIEFGNTSYVIRSKLGNNTFTIIYNDIESDFVLPDGNYTIDYLTEVITEYLIINVPQLSFTIDENNATSKFTSEEFDFSIKFDRIEEYPSLGQIMGFQNERYDSISKVIQGEKIINLIGESYFFLKINDFGKIRHKGKTYFCKVIVDAPKFEVTYDSQKNYVTKDVELIQPINIDRLDVKIVDYYGNNIDQNGIDFSFTLELKIVRNDTVKNYRTSVFHSNELSKILLYDKMLDYFNNKLNNIEGDHQGAISTTYHKILQNEV
jgi:hypothetical protein